MAGGLDFLRGFGRSLTADAMGGLVDLATAGTNLGIAGGGYLAHKAGLIDQPPDLIDPAKVPFGSDWLAKNTPLEGQGEAYDRGRLAGTFLPMAYAAAGKMPRQPNGQLNSLIVPKSWADSHNLPYNTSRMDNPTGSEPFVTLDLKANASPLLGFARSFTLGDVYPQLGSIRGPSGGQLGRLGDAQVNATSLPDGVRGSYSPSTGAIEYDPRKFLNAEDLMRTFEHETNHTLQATANMAGRGANPSMYTLNSGTRANPTRFAEGIRQTQPLDPGLNQIAQTLLRKADNGPQERHLAYESEQGEGLARTGMLTPLRAADQSTLNMHAKRQMGSGGLLNTHVRIRLRDPATGAMTEQIPVPVSELKARGWTAENGRVADQNGRIVGAYYPMD